MLNAGCSVFGIRSEEQPAYKVLFKEGTKEIREYPPQLVAKTTVSGNFESAQNKGFKILAGFIFGDNIPNQKIAMTSPVVQKASQEKKVKIDMTSPVLMSSNTVDKTAPVKAWTMTFTMPSKFSLETLPKPTNPDVIIEKTETRLIAAQTYSGGWSQFRNKKEADKLLKWLSKRSEYKPSSAPMFAGYDPPWTLPFFRRNEALIELEQSQ